VFVYPQAPGAHAGIFMSTSTSKKRRKRKSRSVSVTRRKRKIRPIAVPGRKAFTIDEFCARHGISRAFFYKLKGQGRAPRVTELDAKRLIMEESETAWREAMAEASAA
jgi:hypothetical protein